LTRAASTDEELEDCQRAAERDERDQDDAKERGGRSPSDAREFGSRGHTGVMMMPAFEIFSLLRILPKYVKMHVFSLHLFA
jgi:hypothetical protein